MIQPYPAMDVSKTRRIVMFFMNGQHGLFLHDPSRSEIVPRGGRPEEPSV
jgi:hypothetical protein